MKLKDISQQQWQADVNENSLCLNYRILKENFTLEPYLIRLDFVDRINLAKYRCGSHKLPISVNKYSEQQLPRQCSLCNLNEIGDEFQYSLVCPKFKNETITY